MKKICLISNMSGAKSKARFKGNFHGMESISSVCVLDLNNINEDDLERGKIKIALGN